MVLSLYDVDSLATTLIHLPIALQLSSLTSEDLSIQNVSRNNQLLLMAALDCWEVRASSVPLGAAGGSTLSCRNGSRGVSCLAEIDEEPTLLRPANSAE